MLAVSNITVFIKCPDCMKYIGTSDRWSVQYMLFNPTFLLVLAIMQNSCLISLLGFFRLGMQHQLSYIFCCLFHNHSIWPLMFYQSIHLNANMCRIFITYFLFNIYSSIEKVNCFYVIVNDKHKCGNKKFCCWFDDYCWYVVVSC